MQFESTSMRAWMRRIRHHINMHMRDASVAMLGEHTAIRRELADIRDLVNSVDRSTARIERHLFGIEIAPDPEDGE